jgi:hypothetical protein
MEPPENSISISKTFIKVSFKNLNLEELSKSKLN